MDLARWILFSFIHPFVWCSIVCFFFHKFQNFYVYKYILFVWLYLVSFMLVLFRSLFLSACCFFSFVRVYLCICFHSCHSTSICAAVVVVVDWIQITKNKKGCYWCLHYWYYWMNNFMLYTSVWIPNAGIVNELYSKSQKNAYNVCVIHVFVYCVCRESERAKKKRKKFIAGYNFCIW